MGRENQIIHVEQYFSMRGDLLGERCLGEALSGCVRVDKSCLGDKRIS